MPGFQLVVVLKVGKTKKQTQRVSMRESTSLLDCNCLFLESEQSLLLQVSMGVLTPKVSDKILWNLHYQHQTLYPDQDPASVFTNSF